MEAGTFCTKLPKKVPVQLSWQLLALREQHAATQQERGRVSKVGVRIKSKL